MAERSERDREKNEKSKIQNQTKHVPKDAQIIIAIMKDMGITEYEPRVINQLLEFTYRYVTCVLDDAKIYANHAKKKLINLEDVKLAVQLTLERTFTSPLPREVYVELARTKNHTPLPLIKPHCGLRLPPDRYCLSACNYKLRHLPKKKNGEGRQNVKFSTKGQKDNTGVKRQQNSTGSVSKAQNLTIPKPVFKFSAGAPQKPPAKPKIQINPAPSATPLPDVKMDVDDMPTGKRKREEDDFEIVG